MQRKADHVIIYGDILIAENMVIGGVIMYITAEIHRRWHPDRFFICRFAAGCVMCGLFSLTVFMHAGVPAKMAAEACFALLLCLAVFGKHKLAVVSATFVLVTYFMGGFTMGLLLLTENSGVYTGTGIYTGDMKAGILAIFTALFTVTAKRAVILVRRNRFSEEHVFDVELIIGEIRIRTSGFVDTGNQLRDPVSGKPVAVADSSVWKKLSEAGAMAGERMCLIPYETVDGSGLMYGVRSDRIRMYRRPEGSLMDETAKGGSGPAADVRGCIIAQGKGSFDFDRDHGGTGCSLLLPVYVKRVIR